MTSAGLPFTQWADVSRTERFICVQPMSGHRLILPEDDGYAIYLAPNAADEALGRALLKCLDRSRFIDPPDRRFSDWRRYMPLYKNWQKDFMQRYGYKSKREAYRNWDGAGSNGLRAGFRCSRTSATSQNISTICRRTGQ